MQANNDNESEDDNLEGLALLEQQNPYAVSGIYQLENGGSQCRVVCRGDNGRIKWNKELKKYPLTGTGTRSKIS
ncbi:unnamed protein product [Bathycoccus prasinos]